MYPIPLGKKESVRDNRRSRILTEALRIMTGTGKLAQTAAPNQMGSNDAVEGATTWNRKATSPLSPPSHPQQRPHRALRTPPRPVRNPSPLLLQALPALMSRGARLGTNLSATVRCKSSSGYWRKEWRRRAAHRIIVRPLEFLLKAFLTEVGQYSIVLILCNLFLCIIVLTFFQNREIAQEI